MIHSLRHRPIGRGLLLLLLILSASSLHAQTAGEGREFVLTLPYLSPSLNGGAETFRLSLSSEVGASVRLTLNATGAVTNTVVPSGSTVEVQFDTLDLALPHAEGIFRRSLLVESDAPVTAVIILDRGTASEAYAGIANDLLGYGYRAVAYPSTGEGTFIVVAAIEDRTTVTLTPSVATRLGNPANVPLTVTLNRGEVYQLLSLQRFNPDIVDDLTGSHIVADRPIAVWSGTTCARPPFGNITCGPLIEQLPPVDLLGRDHPFALFPEERQAPWRAVAACAATALRGPDLIAPVDTLLAPAPAFLEVTSFGNGRLLSDEPILLAHFGINISTPPHDQNLPIGDPTMTIVTPVEGMAFRHLVVSPFLPSRADGGGGVPWKHFISITRGTLTTGATIDGVPVAFTGLVAEQVVDAGSHVVEGDRPIAVTAIGRSVSDAYAYVPGGVTRRLPLRADTIEGILCGETYDTTIVIRNMSTADVRVDAADFLNGLNGEIVTPLPLTIPAESGANLAIRLFDVRSGAREGRIMLTSGACAQRVGVVRIDLDEEIIDAVPAFGSIISFQPIPRFAVSTDQVVRVINRKPFPITIDRFGTTHPAFTVVAPPLPLLIPPFSEANVTLRFAPAPEDTIVDGRLFLFSARCPLDSSRSFDLHGEITLLAGLPPSTPLLLCDPKEPGEMTAMFAYYGRDPLTVRDAFIVGDPTEFELLDPITAPLSLGERDTLFLRVRFTPSALGQRNATLRVVTDRSGFDTVDIPLRFENELIDFAVDRDAIDFGAVDCGAEAPQVVSVSNRGTRSVEGMEARLLVGEGFAMTSDPLDPLLVDSTATITVTASGQPGRLYRDTLLLREPICGIEKRIPLSYGCIARGELRIGFREEQGSVGEMRSIPLLIERDAFPSVEGAPFAMTVRVRMRADILLTRDPYVVPADGISVDRITRSVRGAERFLEMRMSGTITSSDTLALLPVLVLLGSDTLTELAIDSIDFLFGDAFHAGTVTPFDGRFIVDGICMIGENRLITASEPPALKITPNPSRESVSVEIRLVEDGGTALLLTDMTGRIIRTIVDQPMARGGWRVAVAVDDLPAGQYFVSLRTPTATMSAPLRIVD